MIRTHFLAATILLFGFSAGLAQTPLPPTADRVPVLAELFTSEGCSTCPPADRFVQSLEAQPIPEIDIIVLSEHVDYWDHQGWVDPYSLPEMSERQRVYGRQFKLADVYTPQLIIDGCRQMSGSDAMEADNALREGRTRHKIDLQITGAVVEKSRLRAHIESATLKSETGLHSLDVFAVVALNHVESQVARGENANLHLTHTAVVRKLTRVGQVKPGDRFSRDIELKTENVDPRNLRMVAFLQDPDSRRIYGAAMQVIGSGLQPNSNAARPGSPTPTTIHK